MAEFGIRVRFRSVWDYSLAGSNPVIRTTMKNLCKEPQQYKYIVFNLVVM